MRPVRVLIAAGAAVALDALDIAEPGLGGSPLRGRAPPPRVPPWRWIVVVAPGLGLSGWPEPVFSDLADRGVVGLMPSGHAADVVARLRAAGAPAARRAVRPRPRSARRMGLGAGDERRRPLGGHRRRRRPRRRRARASAGPRAGGRGARGFAAPRHRRGVAPSRAATRSRSRPSSSPACPPAPSGWPVSSSTRREGIVSLGRHPRRRRRPAFGRTGVRRSGAQGTSLKTRLAILEGIRARVGATDATRKMGVIEAWLTLAPRAARHRRGRRPRSAPGRAAPPGRRRSPSSCLSRCRSAGYVVALALPTAVTRRRPRGATARGRERRRGARRRRRRAPVRAVPRSRRPARTDGGGGRRPTRSSGRRCCSPTSSATRSPTGGRFYGLGNEGAGLLLGSVCTAFASRRSSSRGARSRPHRVLGRPPSFAAAFVVCIAPWWGANIGVGVWGSVLLLVAWCGLLPAGRLEGAGLGRGPARRSGDR